jgi:SAM-dependent methyltransferase
VSSSDRAAEWDAQYREARWEYLGSSRQQPRYAAIAGALAERDAPAHVLDLGCGTGLLRAHLPAARLASYTGVDFSAEATARAREAAAGAGEIPVPAIEAPVPTNETPAPVTTFVEADISTWQPSRAYDVIVFNETLYYLDRPRAVVRAHAHALAAGGVLVVSMYVPAWRRGVRWRARIEAIWWRLERDYAVLDVALPRAPGGERRWRVERLAPRG